jgi:hypothetical protein
VKSKDRLYESWNGSTGMEKRRTKWYSMLGRESLYRVKKKCVGGCTWQKCYNEKVMVKFNYNVDKYI